MKKKRIHSEIKTQLHPRNQLRFRYDFTALCESFPGLSEYVRPNKYGDNSIDYFNPEAVKSLNSAILQKVYKIKNWDIPDGYLCPPIPGRADYIHYIADLLATGNKDKIPKGSNIRCLDIGVGASCIYPIIGSREYGWNFVGTDIDPAALGSAKKIIDANPFLVNKIELRTQVDPGKIFENLMMADEMFDIVICNPPFHTSQEEARDAALRKMNTLKKKNNDRLVLTFGGKDLELWCEGGETKFVSNMILESHKYAHSCLWFSSLVSKEINLDKIYDVLSKSDVHDVETIKMGQGNKRSRIVAWSFLGADKRHKWAKIKWH